MKVSEFFQDSSFDNENSDEIAIEIDKNIELLHDINLTESNTENANNETSSSTKDVKNIEYFYKVIKKNFGANYKNPIEILKEMEELSLDVEIDTFNVLLYNSLNNRDYETFYKLKDLIFANILDESESTIEKGGNKNPRVKPNHTTVIILLKMERFKVKTLLYKKTQNSESDSKLIDEQNNKEEFLKIFDEQLCEIRKIMSSMKLDPNLQIENTIIDTYLEQKRFYKAWEQFQQNKKENLADQYTYSSILKGIQITPNMSADWLDKAFDIMIEAEEKFIKPQEIFYNTLLDICIKFNNIDKAEKLFFDMREKRENLTEHTYSIMIKAYGKIKNLDKAVYIFDEIKNNFKLPSSITYGCMMNLYVKCGYTDLAKNLMIEMDGKGIKQNLHTYSTLINGYRLARNCNSALAIFDRAIREKDQNIVIYNAILDCCIQCEEYKKMKDIFLYLNENSRKNNKFPQPDLITYSIVMKGLAKTNDVDRVLEVYTYLLERKDFQLDKYMYNTIMDFFAKKKEEKNVIMVYNDMLSRNVEIEIVTYGVLIKLYCNLKNHTKALELYQELLDKNMKPNVVILQLILKVLFHTKSNVEKAIGIFRNLKSMDIELDNIIYELVISNCIRYNKYLDAFEFYVRGCTNEIEMSEEIVNNIVWLVISSERLDTNKKKTYLKKFKKEFDDKKLTFKEEIKTLISNFLNDKLEDINTSNKVSNYEAYSGAQKHNQYYNNNNNGLAFHQNNQNHHFNNGTHASYHSYNTHNNHNNHKNRNNNGSNNINGHKNNNYFSNNKKNNNEDYTNSQPGNNFTHTQNTNDGNNKKNNHIHNNNHKKNGIDNYSEIYQKTSISYNNNNNGYSNRNSSRHQTSNNDTMQNLKVNQTYYNGHNKNHNQYHTFNNDQYESKSKVINSNKINAYNNNHNPNNKKNYNSTYDYDYEFQSNEDNYNYYYDSYYPENKFKVSNNYIENKKNNKFELANIQFKPVLNLETIGKPFNENESKYIVECNSYKSHNSSHKSKANYYNNNYYDGKEYVGYGGNSYYKGEYSSKHQNDYSYYNKFYDEERKTYNY